MVLIDVREPFEYCWSHIISEQRELSHQQRQATLNRFAELMREKDAGERSLDTSTNQFAATTDTLDTTNTTDPPM